MAQSGHFETEFRSRRIGSPADSACYFFVIIVIRYETAATARWALLLIVRTLSNDAITVTVWTGFGFHVCLPVEVSIRVEVRRNHRTACSTLTTLNRGSRSIWMFKIKPFGQVATARRSATVFAVTGMPCST